MSMEFDMGKRLIESMREAVEFAKGERNESKVTKHRSIKAVSIPDSINPKEVRLALNMTQEEFAARFGFNLHTLRNWEHNRRHPDRAVLAYLYAISKHPQEIESSLRD